MKEIENAAYIISRAVCPASEYKAVSWIKEDPTICELTGYDIERITKDKPYVYPISYIVKKNNWKIAFAGIAKDANTAWFKSKKYDYLNYIGCTSIISDFFGIIAIFD